MITHHEPKIICLQETLIKSNDTITLNNFASFHHINNRNSKASGGVSIIIHEDVPHRQIPLQTNLQAISNSIILHKTFTICNIYLPPNDNPSFQDLHNLILQLPKPFIILGDFNAHNSIWGSNKNTTRGKLIESIINTHNLCLLNDNTKTYLHPASGTLTNIDLTICDPSLFLDFDWKVYSYLCGSDHFPIYISINNPNPTEPLSNWEF